MRRLWKLGNHQDLSNFGLGLNGRVLTELDKSLIMTFQVQLRVKSYKGTPGPVVRYWPVLIKLNPFLAANVFFPSVSCYTCVMVSFLR